eukprot:Tamp_11600.p4 GENE.Tamp_11600~~Tamp_11600.p4  ORF type:complete len:119 (+),score=14.87 Tamp_11600:1349-1705(+)
MQSAPDTCKKAKHVDCEQTTTGGDSGGGICDNSAAAERATQRVMAHGNASPIIFSEVVTILNDDGGSLLARALAPCLTLQQLWCFGLVNKSFNSVLRNNVWELLLSCRDVEDQGRVVR